MKRNVEKKVNIMVIEKKLVIQEIFMRLIRKEWEAIDVNLCINLVRSIPEHVGMVVESQGHTINF
jgi:hypothetical protein